MTTDLEMEKREHRNKVANVQRFGSGIHASVDCLLFGLKRILERVVPTEVSMIEHHLRIKKKTL